MLISLYIFLESEFSTEVFIGKHHSEKYECGLCDVEAKDLENIEIHLVSCELYHCGGCKIKFKNIKGVTNHIILMEYEDGRYLVYHLRLDRNNQSEVSKKRYRSDDI